MDELTRRMLATAALLGLVTARPAPSAARDATDIGPTLILVSFDGWRSDYVRRYSAPNLERLIKRGASAPLVPSFPSKTFPNHYTLVTGLYPGHHGIVANSILDPPTGRRLTMSNRVEVQSALWWGGEPLWVAVERSGRAAAAVFWPGSEAPILGVRPRYWLPYDEEMPGEARVDRALELLDRPAAERPGFVMLYFSDVDTAGHRSGPRSQEVRDAVARVDGHLGRLISGLARRGTLERVDVVVVSDHGMAETMPDRVVVLDDGLLEGMDVVDLNPTLGVFPRAGTEAQAYRALAGAHRRLRVFRREETPAHWRFREHPRVPPIVGVADEGWQVMRRSTWETLGSRGLLRRAGAHGYDPQRAKSMRGLFVAAGPSFRPGRALPAFENVNVYNALAAALGVEPAPNDGDPGVAMALLRAAHPVPERWRGIAPSAASGGGGARR
jgi:predicted AlkP superfamily pyrophosphatase or phosphodiesterase